MVLVLPRTFRTGDGLTVEGASADLLCQLLSEYDEVTRELGAPVADHLAVGLSRVTIETEFSKCGLPLPEELAVWWSWHNGVKPGRGRQSTWDQLSLGLALEFYRSIPKGSIHGTWNPSWLRFAGYEPNVGLAASCSSDLTAPFVRMTDPVDMGTQPDQTVFQVVSLCTPVTWWLTGMTDGWIAWIPERGRWDIDRAGIPLDWQMPSIL